MKRFLPVVGLLWALAVSAEPKPVPQSRELSADMILRRPGAKDQRGKLYIGKDKLRTELSVPDRGQMAFIYDMGAGKAWMVNPGRQVAMDLTAQFNQAMKVGKGPQGTELLTWRDSNPCSRQVEGRTCAKQGAETVNGRETDKWKVTEKDGKVAIVWMDRALSMPIKTETPSGGMELLNVKEGPQPAELFQVPKDFKVIVTPMGAGPAPGMAPGAGQPGGPRPEGAAPTPPGK